MIINNKYILIFLFLLYSSFGYLFLGTKFIIFTSALIVLSILFLSFRYFKKFLLEKFYFYSFLIFSISISTLISYEIYNLDISLYQIIRSQFWLLLTPIMLFIGNKLSKNRDYFYYENRLNLFYFYFLLLFFLLLFDICFNLNFLPAIIKASNSNYFEMSRYYLLGYQFLLPLLPILLITRNMKFLILFFLLIFFWGGRSFIFISGIILVISFFKARLNFNLLFLSIFFLFIFFFLLSDKLLTFFNFSDVRFLFVKDVFYNMPLGQFFIGKGFGTQLTDGYLLLNPSLEHDDLIINMKYDIENGFVYLFSRLGIFSLLYFWLIRPHFGKYTIFYLCILSILFFTSSPVGPSWCLTFFALGYLSNFYEYFYYSRIK